MIRLSRFATMLLLVLLAAAPHATAQTAPDPPQDRPDPDRRVDPLQPDFTLAALPTTLRLPSHAWSFRVTHRFTRSLGEGSFGDLAGDLFGFDSAAQIGLEVRFGLRPGTQIGVHRTSDRTIQIFGQQSILTQRDGKPLGMDAILTIEGADNLTEHHQGAFGLAFSRKVGRHLAAYAEPIYVVNTNPVVPEAGSDNGTMMLGLGARLRVRPAVYLVGEITPRLGGYDPGVSQMSFGLEGRAGGHLFQLNFSNGFGTTYGQIARGGINNNDWHIGFNISRKFY